MQNLDEISDTEAIVAANILGGADHITNESKIHQFKELMKGRFNKQTNIPGQRWYRVFKYLERQGYKIEEDE